MTKPLIDRPDIVKWDATLISSRKAHDEVSLNVSHDRTSMLLLGHDIKRGYVKTQSALCVLVVFTLRMSDLMTLMTLTTTFTKNNPGVIAQQEQRYLLH